MKQYKNNFIFGLLKSIVVNFLIVLAYSGFFSSLHISNVYYGFLGAVLITLFYKFIRPALMLISIIPIIMTFGVFIIIINAIIILLVSSALAPNFVISSFWSALGLALFISIFNILINSSDRTIIIKKWK